MYGKHFEGTYTGSMFGAGALVFAVWGYVIANTRKSYVELNPNVLAAVIGDVTPAAVSKVLEFLCAPDPHSRSKKNEGRRLIREGQFMYYVPTYTDYNSIRDEGARKDYMRTYMRNYRQCKHDVNQSVNTCKPQLAHSDTDTDTDKKRDMGQQTGPSGGHPIVDPPDEATRLIERLKQIYPKRDGTQRWPQAVKAARQRLKEGTTTQQIEDGVVRYARYCHTRGLTGTERVQQAATFLGTNRGFAEDWNHKKPVLVSSADPKMGSVLR